MLFQSRYVETKSFRRGLSLVSAVLLGLFINSGYANAVVSNAATATADAIVLKPITIVVTGGTALNFGKIAPTGIAGIVKIDPKIGSRTAVDVALLPSIFGAVALLVEGEPNRNFMLNVASTPSITLTGSGDPMLLNLFTAFPLSIGTIPGGVPTTNTLDSNGLLPVTVGGTLHVAGDQLAGVYSGAFDVTVAYQ